MAHGWIKGKINGKDVQVHIEVGRDVGLRFLPEYSKEDLCFDKEGIREIVRYIMVEIF